VVLAIHHRDDFLEEHALEDVGAFIAPRQALGRARGRGVAVLHDDEHRRKHGAYPESLSLLEVKAPEDALTGKPFVIKLDEDTIVLSSAGDAKIAWRLKKE
jgi:hypothetical protein